jgi:hypothetical protein
VRLTHPLACLGAVVRAPVRRRHRQENHKAIKTRDKTMTQSDKTPMQ